MKPHSSATAKPDDRDPGANLRRRGGGPRAGLVLAVGVGLVSAGVIALFALRSSGTGAGGTGAPGTIDPAAKGTLPVADITQTGLRGTGEARVQLVDRNDPSRVAGLMTWTRLEPLPGGRANVNVPRAFVYLRDGRTIHLTAERGVLLFAPGSQEPESGVLEGTVRVSLFAAMPAGQTLDPERASPIATLTTSAITFDRALVEVATTRQFEIASDLVRAKGRGLRLQGNQAAEQLEFLELDELMGDAVVSLRPRKDPAGSEASGRDTSSPTANAAGAGTRAAAPAREAFYRLDIVKPLTARLGSRVVRSAATIAGVRLVDGRLNLDEADPADTERTNSDTSASTGVESTGAGGVASQDSGDLLVRFDGPLTIRALSAADRRADGLDRDDAVVVLKGATEPGTPIFADTVAGLTAHGARAVLVAGSAGSAPAADSRENGERVSPMGARVLELRGDETISASLAAADRGVLEARAIALDMRTGVGALDGPGEVRAVRVRDVRPGSAPAERALSWSGPGSFVLATRDGLASGELREATVTGDVLARDAGSRVRAGVLRAVFAQAASTSDAPLRLSRVELRRGAMAESLGALAQLVGPLSEQERSRVQSLSAEAISVLLDTSRSDTPPTRVLALGDVIARAGQRGAEGQSPGDGVLRAEFVDALLASDPDRPTQNSPTIIVATSPAMVTYIDTGGTIDAPRRTVAFAPRVVLDARAQTAELLGDAAAESPRTAGIAQSSGSGAGSTAAEVVASRIIVRAADSTLDVPGPGTLVVRQPALADTAAANDDARATAASETVGPPVAGDPRLRVAWSTSLRVNDATGMASAAGAIEAINTPTPLQRDTLRAERLDMTFARTGGSGGGRELVRAEAIGQPGDRPRASVESRRFARPSPGAAADGSIAGPVLDRLLYLEGERIIASPSAQTLEVPGPGRLLVDDRRTSAADAVGIGGTGANDAGSRGTSLFSWSGGLTLDQAAGSMGMRDSVRLIHRPAQASAGAAGVTPAGGSNMTLGSIITLDCDTLSAMVRTQPADTGAAGTTTAGILSAQLLSVTAEGTVRAASGSQELSADTARFDAVARRLTAAALADRWVTFLDSSRPTPVQARSLTWDIDAGRYEATDLRPVTLPR